MNQEFNNTVHDYVDKKGNPVCPHIHALISLPDEIIELFESSPLSLELLFRYAVSTHYYQFINQHDELITKCKSLEDVFGNPVFDDVKLLPVRMDDKEDLCQYLTKNLLHTDLVNNPNDHGAGLYDIRGDKLTRSL